jgi:hypothetical protein
MVKTVPLFVVLIFGVASAGLAQDTVISISLEGERDLVPWEPDEIVTTASEQPAWTNSASWPAQLSLWLVGVYQTRIAVKSVGRCPFTPSCSNFAIAAVKKYGFVIGWCLFIDRHLFRENAQVRYLYGLKEINMGVLKVDDSFYIYRGKR